MNNVASIADSADFNEVLTFSVDGQYFAVPARKVQDVLPKQRLAHVPLTRTAVAGLINLRGHIVVALDLRRRLGLAERSPDQKAMYVVIEGRNEHAAIIVDQVGDVLNIDRDRISANPESLSPAWANVCRGVYWLPDSLLLLADINQLLDTSSLAE